MSSYHETIDFHKLASADFWAERLYGVQNDEDEAPVSLFAAAFSGDRCAAEVPPSAAEVLPTLFSADGLRWLSSFRPGPEPLRRELPLSTAFAGPGGRLFDSALPSAEQEAVSLSRLEGETRNRFGTSIRAAFGGRVMGQYAEENTSVVSEQGRPWLPGENRVLLSRADGRSLELELGEILRIAETVDGSFAVYSNGVTRYYGWDGALVREDSACAIDANQDVWIVNSRAGGAVFSGGGDNVVLNFADNVIIHSGSGTDRIFLADGLEGIHFSSGGGRDILFGGALRHSSLGLDSGDNELRLAALDHCWLGAWNGNNDICLGSLEHSALQLDDGHNLVWVQRMGERGQIQAGNGNNRILVERMEADALIRCGNGRNELALGSMCAYACLDLGDGDNKVGIKLLTDNALAQSGNGNNEFSLGEMNAKARLKPGEGDNTLKLRGKVVPL